MTVSDHWTEILRCPDCALTGVAILSQPKGSETVLIETLPAGFRAVSTKYGDTFYCEACNRPASGMTSERATEIEAGAKHRLHPRCQRFTDGGPAAFPVNPIT